MAQLLGIDIGTSSCKVAVFDEGGTCLAQATCDYPVHYPRPGWAEQDPDEWWEAVCRGTREVLSAPGVDAHEIAGVGVDGQSWSCIPIDRNGEVLARAPIWMDSRSDAICRRVREEVGAERIFRLAGNGFASGYTTPKMIWFKEERPEVFARTWRFLQSNSYIVFRLTGAATQDVSQGYGLHFFDMANLRYDEGMARELGLSTDLVPPLSACDAVVGAVTTQAAAETGLVQGTPVVAGGVDSAAGALGAGVYQAGQAQDQGGTAGGVSYCADEPLSDERLILGPHVVPGRWLLQGGTAGGGGVLAWFRRQFGDGASFDDLTALAEDVPPGANGLLFLPYMRGERSPIWNPHAKGVLYGLSFASTKGEVVRALLEGVALSFEHNLRVAREAGARYGELNTMGGTSNSVLWTQIKADITGRRIVVCASDTAATSGDAMVAGVGTGVYGGYDEAVGRFVSVRRIQESDPVAHRAYETVMERYLALSECLVPTFDEFAQ